MDGHAGLCCRDAGDCQSLQHVRRSGSQPTHRQLTLPRQPESPGRPAPQIAADAGRLGNACTAMGKAIAGLTSREPAAPC